MSELWIAIGIVFIALIFSMVALAFHRRLGAESLPDTLKNTVEVMKLCGLFNVAAVSFYFIDFQKQREEREKFDIDIYKAFAEQGSKGTAEQSWASAKPCVSIVSIR